MTDQNQPLGAGYEMTMVRTFKAPPELVFDCFVEPERLAAWWGPAGCVNTELDIDPQPGGNLSLRMAGEGYSHVMGGEYVELDRPRKLVFKSKAFEAPDGGWGIINRNTLTFEAVDGGTRMTLHTLVERAEGELVLGALGGMHIGWGQSIDRLEALVDG